MESSKPFPETVRSILELEGLSGRDLANRCQEHGWGSVATIARILRGQDRASENAMFQIARALHVSPETFAEYRLLQQRKKLDPEEVGLQAALKYLGRVERAAGR